MGYEKLGSDQSQLAGFGGGVVSEEGAVLLSGESTGEQSILFGPAALREMQAGIANGDFAIPPLDPLATIVQDGNPLPYWTFTDVNSAGAITCAIVANATTASGNVLRWSVAGGTTTGKSATLTRYVPIIGSRNRSFAYAYDSHWISATASTVITATIGFEFFDASLSSAGSGASTTETFTTIGAAYDLQAPEWAGVAIDAEFANTTAPDDAAFAKVTITIATTGTVSAGAKTIDLVEVRQITGGAGILLPDLSNPNTFSTGAIYQSDGSISIMPVAGDTLGLYGRIDVSPNVVITAPSDVSITNGTTEGTLNVQNVRSAGDLRLLAAGGDVYLNSTTVNVGPRLLFRDSAGTFYGGLRMEGANVFRFYNGSATNDYAYIYAERFYPMNGTTASRYIDDDGTNIRFSSGLTIGGGTTTTTGIFKSTGNGFENDAPVTTTATTNAAIWVLVSGTNYSLRRNSSSARYKTNIENADAAVLEAAKKVKPRHYQSTIAEENGATRLGFIAEEIHEAGLTHAVGYDEQGRPETIDNTALIAALWHRVNELEARLAAIEGQP